MIARAGLPDLCRSALISFVAARHFAFPLTLGASALVGGLVTMAMIEKPAVGRQEAKLETARPAIIRNETIIYRQDPEPNADQVYSENPYAEQIEASDRLEDDDNPSNFPRSVQTVRFVNPDAPAGTLEMTARPRDAIREALVKIGDFVAFRPKEAITDEESTLPRKRTGSIMDQVDDYLWEVYQRVPIKKDGTGDFTWKDPAAAKHMGLCMQDYVIGGMDPEFREQLYHAGRAMDAAGLQWSMLSAFRDDYRQGLASGYKAGVSNSLHGGSRRTGGYSHGRAIDITGPDGRESEVWKWIDDHGAKFGLHRPLPKADPAHVQQRGDWQKIALALRESRTGSAVGEKTKVAATGGKARVRKTTDGKTKARKTAMASVR
jgi:hypothetical protein